MLFFTSQGTVTFCLIRHGSEKDWIKNKEKNNHCLPFIPATVGRVSGATWKHLNIWQNFVLMSSASCFSSEICHSELSFCGLHMDLRAQWLEKLGENSKVCAVVEQSHCSDTLASHSKDKCGSRALAVANKAARGKGGKSVKWGKD